jgi:hypothetical protein
MNMLGLMGRHNQIDHVLMYRMCVHVHLMSDVSDEVTVMLEGLYFKKPNDVEVKE